MCFIERKILYLPSLDMYRCIQEGRGYVKRRISWFKRGRRINAGRLPVILYSKANFFFFFLSVFCGRIKMKKKKSTEVLNWSWLKVFVGMDRLIDWICLFCFRRKLNRRNVLSQDGQLAAESCFTVQYHRSRLRWVFLNCFKFNTSYYI